MGKFLYAILFAVITLSSWGQDLGEFYFFGGDTLQAPMKKHSWLDPFMVKVSVDGKVQELTSEQLVGFKDPKGRVFVSRYIYDPKMGLVRVFLVTIAPNTEWGTLLGRYAPRPWSANETGDWTYYLDSQDDGTLVAIDPFNFTDLLSGINPKWEEGLNFGRINFEDIPELFIQGEHYAPANIHSSQTWISRFEVPVFVNTSIVKLPDALSQLIPEFGGIGYDFGLGWGIRNQQRKWAISAGLHYWSVDFSPQFQFKHTDNGEEKTMSAIQKGSFKNSGLYLKVVKETRNTLFGVGMDFAFLSAFQGSTKIYDEGVEVDSFESNNTLIGVGDQNPIDVNLLIGGKYRTESGVGVKPFFQLNLPIIPIISDGRIDVPNRLDLAFPGVVFIASTRIGIIFEFGPDIR